MGIEEMMIGITGGEMKVEEEKEKTIDEEMIEIEEEMTIDEEMKNLKEIEKKDQVKEKKEMI